jgi:hypothetical protein
MQKKHRIYLMLFIVCVIALNAGSYGYIPEPAESYVLKYEMPVGTRFVITGRNFFERETVLPDGGLTGNTIEHTFEGSFEIEEAQGLGLKMVFQKLACEKNNPGGTFLDSFDSLTGYEVGFTLSPEGELSGLEDFDNLPEKEVLLRISAPDNFVHGAHNAFPHLPDKPVGPGDTWTYKMESVRPFSRGARSLVTSEYTYRFSEVVEKDGIPCVKIEVSFVQTSKVEIDTPRGTTVAEHTGKGRETVYFAYTKGMFLSKQGVIEVNGSFGESPQTDHVEYTYQTKFIR